MSSRNANNDGTNSCVDSFGNVVNCNSAWYDWGRWVTLVIVLVGIVLLFFLCRYGDHLKHPVYDAKFSIAAFPPAAAAVKVSAHSTALVGLASRHGDTDLLSITLAMFNNSLILSKISSMADTMVVLRAIISRVSQLVIATEVTMEISHSKNLRCNRRRECMGMILGRLRLRKCMVLRSRWRQSMKFLRMEQYRMERSNE
jgi:hypothetical protein